MTEKKKPPKKAASKSTAPSVRSRKNDFEKLRKQIDVLTIIETLEQHVIGKKKMSPTQVRAALALLQKTMPDLSDAARRAGKEGNAHEAALMQLE